MPTTLHITGMTCDACVRHVSLALAAVPGADSVSVDLASGTARIAGSADPQALITAVIEDGYGAQLQPPGTRTATDGCGCGAADGECGAPR